jgi:hypothetical protein
MTENTIVIYRQRGIAIGRKWKKEKENQYPYSSYMRTVYKLYVCIYIYILYIYIYILYKELLVHPPSIQREQKSKRARLLICPHPGGALCVCSWESGGFQLFKCGYPYLCKTIQLQKAASCRGVPLFLFILPFFLPDLYFFHSSNFFFLVYFFPLCERATTSFRPSLE